MTDNSQTINAEHKQGRINRTLRKTFISLRNRNFRLFFIGQTISNIGNWLTNVALTLFVLKLTHSGLAVGLVAACQYGPILFLSAWAGSIADRSNKWRMLLTTQSLEMCQSIGLAILAFMPHPALGGLYILAIVGGILLAFDNPVRRSFVTEMVREEDVSNAAVLYSNTSNVAKIFGPALAGLLIVTLGYGWCFTVDASTYLVVLFCILIMNVKELRRFQIEPRNKNKDEVSEGIRYILSEPVLWISFAMVAAIGTLAYNFTVTLPLFVINSLHSSVGTFTILYSIFSVGAVVGALVVAYFGLVKIRHVIIGAFALGLVMILLAITPGIKIAALIILLIGMALILFMTSTTAIIQVEAKREMHGRLLAIQAVFIAGTSVVGGPLCGWLADILGARAPIIIGGIVCLLSAIFGYLATKHYAPEKLLKVA